MKRFFACVFVFATLLCGPMSFARLEVTAHFPGEMRDSENKDEYISRFFGNVMLNTSYSMTWDISNPGEDEISLLSFRSQGAMFSANTNCQQVLPPKSKCQMRVRYWPFTVGYHSGAVDMIFDKGGNLYFDFWGYGVK